MEDLKDEIRQTFSSYKTSSKTKQNNPAEVSMVAAAKTTSTSTNKSGKKFKGDSRLCGTKGHKAADCWGNEKNKDKRPDWYKESANVSTGTTRGKLNCTYCGKDNHTVDRCFKKEKDDK